MSVDGEQERQLWIENGAPRVRPTDWASMVVGTPKGNIVNIFITISWIGIFVEQLHWKYFNLNLIVRFWAGLHMIIFEIKVST